MHRIQNRLATIVCALNPDTLAGFKGGTPRKGKGGEGRGREEGREDGHPKLLDVDTHLLEVFRIVSF